MKKLVVIILFACTLIFQFCSSSKKLKKTSNPGAITYTSSIQPIVASNCTPCHFPPKGNKKPLDNYEALKSNIDEIISRIQRNPGEHGFMPAMHPKLPDSTVQMFVQWKNQGLSEK